MKCRTCGAEIETGAVFCPQCGDRLELQNAAEGEGNPTPGDAAAPPNPAERLRANAAADDDAELDLWNGGYSPKAMVGAFVLAAMASIVLFVVAFLFAWAGIPLVIAVGAVVVLWLYLGLTVLYRRMNVRYRLTNQRFFHESGILRRVTDRIEAIDMDDITFDQKLLERMLGVGTIHIVSSDRTHPVLDLPGIDEVARVATMIDEARRKERVRRGLHIEAV